MPQLNAERSDLILKHIELWSHEKQNSKIEDGTGGLAVPGGGATKTNVANPSVHQTQALQVGWTSSAGQLTYSVPAGQRDASSFEVLSFRAAQTNSASNPAGNQDFLVELTGGGHTASTFLSNSGVIPHPYPRGGGFAQDVMTTVRIPLHAFIMNHAGVTLDNIDTIRFRFWSPTQGAISLR